MAFWAPAPAPVAKARGRTPKPKASEVMTIGRSLSFAPFQRRLDQPHPSPDVGLGELNDQDGVLGRKPESGQKADLEVDIVGQTPQAT